ncbi:GSCFA domain-containing protein [Sinomicrobium sp.]
MKLQTQIPISSGNNHIDYHSRILLLGSCFVEHIGNKLDYFQFRILKNPFGILFHPGAIARFLDRVVSGSKYEADELFEQQGSWRCFDAHSALGNTSRVQALANINTALEETASFLKTTTHIVITLGTAWEYRLKETGQAVANCHKIPQSRFTKKLSSVEDVAGSIVRIRENILAINPDVHFVFTISPVRHLKDGFVENQRSKAHLIAALHQVIPQENYFTAYEIVMDELRDYRFYAEDMMHPNATAINYIWEKFAAAHIAPQAIPVMKEVDVIRKGLSHRPFSPDSAEYRDFKSKLNKRIHRLKSEWRYMKFE